MFKLLIVCRGNTCRSPMAEYILKDIIEKAGQTQAIHVESAGTHKGSRLTSTVHDVLEDHKIDHDSQRAARSIHDIQLETFDRILVMDKGVQHDTLAKITNANIREKVALFLNDAEVSDPYGGDKHLYEETYQIIYSACTALISEINQTDLET